MKLPKQKCRKKLSTRKAAKGSFRWKKSGSAYLLIACPARKWDKKKGKCKVGTFAVEEVKAARAGACPTGMKRAR